MSEENNIFGDLSYDELLFVHEFLKDRNRTKAAERIGKNPAWAATWGSITYRKPNVRAAIDEAMGIRAERTGINADWVLTEAAAMFKIDIDEIINRDDPRDPFIDLSLASPDLLQYIDSIEISPTKFGTKVKLNLPNKLKLLETIGKHVGVNAFKEIIEHSGKMSVVFDEQDKEA